MDRRMPHVGEAAWQDKDVSALSEALNRRSQVDKKLLDCIRNRLACYRSVRLVGTVVGYFSHPLGRRLVCPVRSGSEGNPAAQAGVHPRTTNRSGPRAVTRSGGCMTGATES